MNSNNISILKEEDMILQIMNKIKVYRSTRKEGESSDNFAKMLSIEEIELLSRISNKLYGSQNKIDSFLSRWH